MVAAYHGAGQTIRVKQRHKKNFKVVAICLQGCSRRMMIFTISPSRLDTRVSGCTIYKVDALCQRL